MSNQSNFKKFIDEIILEVEKELEEETTSGDAAGYQTPNAFSGKDSKSKKKTKDVATQAGYTVVNEARHIDFAYIIKNLKQYKSKQIDFPRLVDALSVDLGIKQNKKAVKNLEQHLHMIGDELDDMSQSDMKGTASELLNMRFENINEGIWPKSKLPDSFEFQLSAELKKFKKGIWYVVGRTLFYNDNRVINIGGNDSVDDVLNRVKKKRLKEVAPTRVNRWLELKNDDTMHTNKKLSVGMMKMRNQLKEVEKYLGWYNKLKNVNEVEANTYFKRTVSNIGKIKERIVNIARKIQELEKDSPKDDISEKVEKKLYDTENKRKKAIRKKGNIITFKKKFGPTTDSHKQISSNGLDRYTDNQHHKYIKISGRGYDTDWYNSESELLDAIDWEWMEKSHKKDY